jgi:hypothetical protein
MSNKAHLAVHVCYRNGTPVTKTVIQPRNELGQFRSPTLRAIRNALTSHATLNGEVVRKGYLTR